ncbi:MAG: hypothetical protein K6G55_04195 [Selenomonadaceae bacterium]|nr:hypothetical protein [Selenomonadaceae bacterium]
MTNEMIKEEMMNDEELNNVVGGTIRETESDWDYVTRYTGIRFHGDYNQKVEQLYNFLRDNGIGFDAHRESPNEYFYNGRSAERGAAMQYAVTTYLRKHGY